MFLPSPTIDEIAVMPASEALFFGAALAHIDAYYEKMRMDRIDRQNRMVLRRLGVIR